MNRAWTWLWSVLLVALPLVPSIALACPSCAGRDDGAGGRTVWLMGSMILIPFGIAVVVHRVVRRLEREGSQQPRLGSDS